MGLSLAAHTNAFWEVIKEKNASWNFTKSSSDPSHS